MHKKDDLVKERNTEAHKWRFKHKKRKILSIKEDIAMKGSKNSINKKRCK